jgi:hypothetical protein
MSSSKIWTYEGTLRQVFICLSPSTQYPLRPLHTVYVYTVYLFTREGGLGGGGELNQREGERGNKVEYCTDQKAGLKIPT